MKVSNQKVEIQRKKSEKSNPNKKRIVQINPILPTIQQSDQKKIEPEPKTPEKGKDEDSNPLKLKIPKNSIGKVQQSPVDSNKFDNTPSKTVQRQKI